MTDNDYVRSYGKPVMMGHNMFFGSTSYYVHTNGAANFSTVSSSAANIATLNATNVNVTNNLRANHYDLQTVAQLGGSFYVSPTVKFPNSGTTLTVAKSGSTLTLTITDSSITSTTMAGVVWSANSRVKVSGTINGVVTGTMDGTVSSINTSSHTLTLSVSGENSASVPVGSFTASQFSGLTVMIYYLRNGSNNYRVGIWMNCYDVANSSSTIRIYGGSDANPNVMLGNLTSAGLGTVNNLTPTGWGLFAQNAFLHGKVVANGGLIGNWTIGTTGMYYNSDAPGSNSITMIPGGTTASTTSIGGSSGSKQWIFTGKNLFGIDTTGKLYASSAEISGKITANTGHIGGTSGWTIASQQLSSGTIGADNSMFLGTKNLGSNTTIANRSGSDWRFTVGSSFGVTNTGALYSISGNIGGVHIIKSALYSGSKNAYNSNNQGFYFGSDGKFAIGMNNTQYIKWDGSSLSMNVNAISIGGDNVATAITNAGKVATNYLYYDTTNGLVVHQNNSEISSVSNLTGNVGNVRITGNGVDIYRGQTKTASYGSEVVIGPSILSSESPSNIKINTNGFQYNNGGDEAFYVGVEQRVTEISEEEDENETAPSDDDIIDRQIYGYIRICELEKKDTDEGGYMYHQTEPVDKWIVYDSLKVFQRSTKDSKCDVLLDYYIDNYVVWALPQNENDVKLALCPDSCIKTIDGITYYETWYYDIPDSDKNHVAAQNGYVQGPFKDEFDNDVYYTSIYKDKLVNSITGEEYENVTLSAQSATTVANEDFIDEVHAVGGAIYYKIYVVPENVIVKSVIRTSDGSLLLPDEEWYIDENRGLWVMDDYHVKYTIAYVGDTESPYFVFGPNTYSSGEPAGKYSFAAGDHCSAKGSNQAVFGRYNKRSSSPAFIIGNGTEEVRSNCFTIDWYGNVMANGQLFSNDKLTSADIDECFQ